jgi:Cu+-exporting ATPase
VGAFIVRSNYRTGLNKLIKQLKKRFALTVLSGDNEKEKEKLGTLFPKESNLHFNQKPESKLEHIQQLQASGESVMMVGDGLNDAGALKISDFGVAITDDMAAFTPASDAILHGSQLQNLNKFMHFIDQSKMVLKLAFVLSFLYNIVGLSFAVSGNLTPIFAAILMPISSITVVVFATLTINFLAYRQFEWKPNGEPQLNKVPKPNYK